MALSFPEVLERLRARNFDSLVGEFESPWLECKQAPYQLKAEIGKLELAKDVSGFANAGGGVILLGFSTTKDATHGVDVIDAVRSIPLHLFDREQYEAVISAWTWPRFGAVEIEIHTDSSKPGHGIVSIAVAQCAAHDHPILLCRTILADGERADILLGYCERKQAGVAHHDISRLHSLISQGARFNLVVERLDGFAALLTPSQIVPPQQDATIPSAASQNVTTQFVTTGAPAAVPVSLSNVDGRIQESLLAVQLVDAAAFVLAAVPYSTVNFRELFSSRESALVRLVEQPPELRQHGFDLTVDRSSHIVRGLLRRSVVPEAKLLEFHRDGLIVFVNRGDENGLCWGRRDAQRPPRLINQLVLVENTYLFAKVVHEAYRGRHPGRGDVEYRLRLNGVGSAEQPCILESGPIADWRDGSKNSDHDLSIAVATVCPFEEAPGRVAYLLLGELYNRFGFECDAVPYRKARADGEFEIDEGEIQAGGRQ